MATWMAGHNGRRILTYWNSAAASDRSAPTGTKRSAIPVGSPTGPALDQRLWAPSVAAPWAATAALTAIYAPAAAAQAGLPDPPAGPQAAEEAFARAVEHGDEHVVKFADTAADVYARTGSPDAVAAAVRAAQLISR